MSAYIDIHDDFADSSEPPFMGLGLVLLLIIAVAGAAKIGGYW